MSGIIHWHTKKTLFVSPFRFFLTFIILFGMIIKSNMSIAAENILKDAKYSCTKYNHQFNITTDSHFVVTNGVLFMTLDDFVVKQDSQPFKLFLGPKKETGILFSYYATDLYPSDRPTSFEKYENPMLRRTIRVRHSYPEDKALSIAYWFMETVDGKVVDGNEAYYDCVMQSD